LIFDVNSEPHVDSETLFSAALENRDYTHTFGVHANSIMIFFTGGMDEDTNWASHILSVYVKQLIALV